jgi:hypothetical protein
MLLREAIKGAPGSEEERGEVVRKIIENYRIGKVTKEQVEKIAQDIRISLIQTNNYPSDYRESKDQSNDALQQRSHSTLPNSGNSSETKTNGPSLTTPGIETTWNSRVQTGAGQVISDLQGPSMRPTPQAPATVIQQIDQNLNVACLICGCPVGVTSQDLIKKAWDALNANSGGMDPKNFEKALACTKVTIARFAGDADEQQATRLQANECKKTPAKEEKERDAYFGSYWALSDVAAAWFIRGQVLEQQKNCKEAKEAYQAIVAKYNCAYIWDPRGWFWNAAKGADQALKNLESDGCR